MQILEKVKVTYDIPIVTDVHESYQVIYCLLPLCALHDRVSAFWGYRLLCFLSDSLLNRHDYSCSFCCLLITFFNFSFLKIYIVLLFLIFRTLNLHTRSYCGCHLSHDLFCFLIYQLQFLLIFCFGRTVWILFLIYGLRLLDCHKWWWSLMVSDLVFQFSVKL